MKAPIRIAAGTLVLLTLLLAYNNCSKGLPEQATNASSDSGGPPGASLTALAGRMNPASVFTDQGSSAEISGGQPPYSFSISQGSAMITNAGVIAAPLSVGTAIVRVRDSADQTLDLALSISARSVAAGTGAACTLPWGGSIADGQSVAAFNSATIKCPAANTCASQTRTCTNGTLSGTYTVPNGCSYRSCVYKLTAYSRIYDTLCNGAGIARAPTSCTAAQYNSSVCVAGEAGFGDSAYPLFQSFACKGPDEVVTATDSTPGATGN